MRRMLFVAALIAAAAPALAASPAPTPHIVVFFQSWSAKLDDPAMRAIQTAAGWAKQHPAEALTVIGYASTIGSIAANKDLARLRSQIVTDTLVADGVPAEQIKRHSAGATEYEMDPVEARRVEIGLGEP